MKFLKRLPLLLGTLLLIGTGAVMPWAAGQIQDHYSISSQEVLPFDPVSLTLRKDSEIGSVLRLVGDFYDETEWPGETALTEEEACSAALGALAQLDQAGLLDFIYGDYEALGILENLKASGGSKAIPLLVISEYGSSAIIWSCQWKTTEGLNYTLLVDDATGLAVIGYIVCPLGEVLETVYQRMERWRIFFQDYYGIEIPMVEENIFDAGHQFIFRFDPEDGLGECGLSVYLYDYEMVFYPCSQEELALFQEDHEDYSAPAAVVPGSDLPAGTEIQMIPAQMIPPDFSTSN